MRKDENRRQFLQKFGLISLAAGAGNFIPVSSFGHSSGSITSNEKIDLVSLSPSALFSVLDLDLPELAAVRKALDRKGNDAALTALLNYYRTRYPKPSALPNRSLKESESRVVSRADNLVKHIFQWGPYAAADYGAQIDWASDPAGDIEWVAAVYRFYWANDLTEAYKLTGNEQYAKTFVELTIDWIKKHPLEKTLNIAHPVYKSWNGYPWLDLQTGIRATVLCSCFRVMVHTRSFTPHFLGLMLASLYDHQVKTEKMPMRRVHNKAIFEQRGFFNVIHTFSEFKDKDRWLDIAINLTSENLIAQTTADGVQREWCGGYHLGVYRDALEIDSRVRDLGREMPDYYVCRVRGMADYIFGIATPELAFPMFGNTSRGKPQSTDRKTWSLYERLLEAGKRFEDPKFQALANLDPAHLPTNGSNAFSEAGMYAMRNNWSPDQVYMALHCSTPGINDYHDTPDNGTFELYAYGRWLMPDTGFYTYGGDPVARAWHRQTRVHPTLTVNGRDTNRAGRQLLWQSDENNDILCVENHSYQHFLHRRTIWFADKKSEMPFFVILDEANGDLSGDIEIHFPMAPGPVLADNGSLSITTGYDEANLLIKVACKHPVSLYTEDGWHAWEYGKREKRTSVTAKYKGTGPTAFVSVLVPFRGKSVPECRLLNDTSEMISGRDPFLIQVEVAGKKHLLERRLPKIQYTNC
jgi:hypothetical protein